MRFIDIKKQYEVYKESIDQAIHQVLDSANFIMGEEVQVLEKTLADFVGVDYCLSTASGTDSLLIALMALGIGNGDEVITVPFTQISPAEMIKLSGATPRFVDIDAATYTIDVDQIASAITPRTKAIIPVSLFGQMPDYSSINAIAEKHGIPVIEDGAQSFGATQRGKKSCGVTTIGSTSFFPAKPLGCYGDGGALFTNDQALADKMETIRIHGSKEKHIHLCLGVNGRLDTLQAAILLAKFPHFPAELEIRERIAERYSKHLQDCCTVPIVKEGNTHIFAQYTVRVPNRDKVAEELQQRGIPTAVHYPKCLHEQEVFTTLGYTRGDFPVAEKVSQEVISLPMHPWLSEDEQNRIIDAVKDVLTVHV